MSLAGTSGEGRDPAPASPLPCPATFYVAQGGNDIYWRAEAPARAIGARVCVLPEADLERALLGPNTDTAFPWQLLQDRNDPGYYEARYPEHRGAAVWIRPDPPRAVHAAQMREQGVLTVSEVDDNYLSPAVHNIFQRASGYGPLQAEQHLRSLASMERIVFSTVWLRDYYHRAIRKQLGVKKHQMPELFVCRNNIDEADWPTPVPRGNRLRVGWMGSPSHVWDVDLAWNALLHASRLGCETFMIGYNPADPDHGQFPDEQRTEKSRHKINQWRKVGYTYVPWQKPSTYHRAALPLDIGLAPLHHNVHCDGKSAVKWLEFSISGAAAIAWNTPVYSPAIKHMETGILVGSQEEAVRAVDLLIRDEALRERLVLNAREEIRANWGLRELRAEWGAAIAPS